ncbi:MAG: DUF4399 domain-containing protein [Proteobacteria bacterium]|nr:DUF4399 domain-containing protein [Pseudomonadota bacterium]
MDVLGAQASLISTAPEGAALYFIEPVDGATVQSPFVVKFGLKGMGVAPAGIDIANTGHHHLLVNSPLVDESTPLPTSDQVRHFGGGQTEAEISLPKGTHQLQLVLGNYLHIPHDPAVKSPTITITVR